MTHLKNVEEQIRQAMEKGEFDNLTGQGEPIDLEAYFKAPEHLRLAYHILKDAGYIPPEVKLKKEIELLKKQRDAADDKNEKARLNREVIEKTAIYNMALEQLRTAGDVK